MGMLSRANFNSSLASKKEILFGVNIILRYFIRSFEEFYLSCRGVCQCLAGNVQWAFNNPVDFLLFMVLYLILVIMIHSFIQSILRMIGVIQSDESESDLNNKPKRSRRRRRSYLNPPKKLFVLYEGTGEDEEYEVCFESFRKAQEENVLLLSNVKLTHSDSTDISNSDNEKEVSESSEQRPKLDSDKFLDSTTKNDN